MRLKTTRISKVVKRYMVSYVGIVLSTCVLLGVVLFSSSVQELNSTYRDTQLERLHIASTTLDNNLIRMQEMGYLLEKSSLLRSAYLSRDTYNSFDALDYLSRFRGYVPLTEEYFLMYRDDTRVFKVTDSVATNTFDIFAGQLNVKTHSRREALYHQINTCEDITVIIPNETQGSTNSVQNDFALFLFPLDFSETDMDQAVLGFIVRSSHLTSILEAVIGSDIPALTISFDGQQFFSSAKTKATFRSPQTATAFNDHLVLEMEMDAFSSHTRLADYTRTMYVYLIVIVALLICGSVWLAWRSYRPIREITRRYHPTFSEHDELSALSALFENLFEEKRLSAERLREEMDNLSEQRRAIRRQIVQLLICGQFDLSNRSELRYLDLSGDASAFSILALYPHNEGFVDAYQFLQKIEALSDDTLTLRGTLLAGEECAVFLCAARSPDEMRDVRELVEALASELEQPVRSVQGLCCDNLRRLPVSFLDALNKAEMPADQTQGPLFSASDIWIRRMIGEVENGNEAPALNCLHQILSLLTPNVPLFVRMCVFSNITNALMQLIYRLELNIADEQANMIAILQAPDNFQAVAASLIARICQAVNQQDTTRTSDLQTALLSYIREHISDYDLNLSSLGQALSIPEKSITHLIREATGLSYKEYLNEARVERARELLTVENKTVTETCALVGLSEVSYFIRIFKRITGETPANYKRRILESRDTDASDSVT